jgi:hypothetical protein
MLADFVDAGFFQKRRTSALYSKSADGQAGLNADLPGYLSQGRSAAVVLKRQYLATSGRLWLDLAKIDQVFFS